MSKHKASADRKLSKKTIVGITAVSLAVILIILSLIVLTRWEKEQGNSPTQIPLSSPADNSVRYNGKSYTPKNNLETLLVMGLDKYEGQIESDSYINDLQADFLMLFVIDHANSKVCSIHVNRDTMVDIQRPTLNGDTISVNAQIALTYAYGDGGKGSCIDTSKAVSSVLQGVDIEHYIAITMDAVPVYNDLVDGVEVTVLDDFTGIDDTLIEGETVTLYGEHALNYVRTRYGLEDSTNSTRMERQRQYLTALLDKTNLCIEEDDSFIFDAVQTISPYMISDCTSQRLETLFESLTSYEFTDIYQLEGENVAGDSHMEFYVDDISVKDVVMQVFYTPES